MVPPMEKPTLLILAAGMGSRYGGLKQMDPVGPAGEIVLDAHGAISITERTGYIARVRNLASAVARLYAEQRKDMGYPMLHL